jgi:hypothetical protein
MGNDLPDSLLRLFVEDGLNEGSVEVIDQIFSKAFRDHHPLSLPPLFETNPFVVGSLEGLRSMVRVLRSDMLDIGFSLTEMIKADGRIAYRIFGEGAVRTLVGTGYGATPVNSLVATTGSPNVERPAPTALAKQGTAVLSNILKEPARILGDRVHIEIESIGIFHIRNGHFVERWGPWLVA